MLVGTKSDARDDPKLVSELKNDRIVTTEEGQKLAAEIKAFDYVETSALTRHNVNKVFDSCLESVYGKKKGESSSGEKKKCTIL
jgi:GTPase SAR1 family protein